MTLKLLSRVKAALVATFRRFDAGDVARYLSEIGVRRGGTLMLHSSWRQLNGFEGTPAQFCAALRDHLGREGLLVMPSLTYHNMSSAQYLKSAKPMDVRRSPSAMGLVSEVFRRGKDVARSLSPTHPLLAWGTEASAFVAGHERTDRPFGPGSPFGRLLERDAMLVCLDCAFSTITFTHYVEDCLEDTLPVPLYEPEPMMGIVIDEHGNRIECPTRVLSAQANRLRRDDRLEAHLRQAGTLRSRRVGNAQFESIRAVDLLAGARALVAGGNHFFQTPAKAGQPH
jgi:aminoglycoside 3-N-acetyltransferase